MIPHEVLFVIYQASKEENTLLKGFLPTWKLRWKSAWKSWSMFHVHI